MIARRFWVTLLALSVAALTSSCARDPDVPYVSLASGLEPLAAEFNAHVGQVRVVMLVAPT